MPKRDDVSVAVVDAAGELLGRWGRRGQKADLTIIIRPINRLSWRRWRIVEGLDVRVGCNRNPPPEGLVAGGHRALLYPIRERRPFSPEWTTIEGVGSVIAKIDGQLGQWTTVT